VIGTSKGKGFAGVVKRHHFGGGPASHGHKDNLRMPGSIGAGGVQRVFKGMRMAGRMGGDRVTVKNLEIVKIDEATGELFIKGAVPGARNGFLIISGPGELQVLKSAPVQNDQVKNDVQEVVVTQQNDSVAESITSSENSKIDSPEEVKSEENKV
jgi:large subunit ribosomal protein L3